MQIHIDAFFVVLHLSIGQDPRHAARRKVPPGAILVDITHAAAGAATGGRRGDDP